MHGITLVWLCKLTFFITLLGPVLKSALGGLGLRTTANVMGVLVAKRESGKAGSP